MRLVKRFSALLIALILVFFATPVQAALAAETAPYVGSAPLPTLVGLTVGLIAVGITLQLTAKDPDSGDEKIVDLDTESDSFTKDFRRYVRLKVQEKLAPTKEKLQAIQGEADALQGILVGEILRIKKLTEGEDFDAEAEKEYLTGLPAERLKMEFERLPSREDVKAPETATENAEPDDLGSEIEDVYGDAVE